MYVASTTGACRRRRRKRGLSISQNQACGSETREGWQRRGKSAGECSHQATLRHSFVRCAARSCGIAVVSTQPSSRSEHAGQQNHCTASGYPDRALMYRLSHHNLKQNALYMRCSALLRTSACALSASTIPRARARTRTIGGGCLDGSLHLVCQGRPARFFGLPGQRHNLRDGASRQLSHVFAKLGRILIEEGQLHAERDIVALHLLLNLPARMKA